MIFQSFRGVKRVGQSRDQLSPSRRLYLYITKYILTCYGRLQRTEMQFMRASPLLTLNALVKQPDNLSATLITPSEAMTISCASQNILFCKQSISHDKVVKIRTKRHLPKKAMSCRVFGSIGCVHTVTSRTSLYTRYSFQPLDMTTVHIVYSRWLPQRKKNMYSKNRNSASNTCIYIIRVRYEHDPTSFQLSWTKMKQQMK